MRQIFLSLLIFTSINAEAKKDKSDSGVEIQIKVIDKKTKKPIPTAFIKYENYTSDVNSVTGVWRGSEVYNDEGEITIFKPKLKINLQISAPGYNPHDFTYEIRRWRNKSTVKLEEQSDDEEFKKPHISFDKNTPKD